MTKNNHGGKREGAGRPKQEPSTAHGIRLANEVWALRDRMAELLGKPKREIMEEAIREKAERHGIKPEQP